MGGPPGVGDADQALPGRTSQIGFQGLDFSDRLLAEDFPALHNRQAAGIIPTVLQLPESLQQNRKGRSLAKITENSTHKLGF